MARRADTAQISLIEYGIMPAGQRFTIGEPIHVGIREEKKLALEVRAARAARPRDEHADEMDFLSFYGKPLLSEHDIAWYMRIKRRFGGRADFDKILQSESKNFDDYPNLLLAVRTFHGKAENSFTSKTHRNAQTSQEIKRITSNEKILSQIPPGEEKDRIARVTQVFQGRLIENRSALAEDGQAGR